MKRTLHQASNRKADCHGRHTERKGHQLLPDDCPHVNDDSKPVARPELAITRGSTPI